LSASTGSGLGGPHCVCLHAPLLVLVALIFPTLPCLAQPVPQPPLVPFQSDEHTLLLYHFDEGRGDVVKDSGPGGYDGALRGPKWVPGRFGTALWFDGKDDSVFREVPQAIQKLKQITVECWFNQEDPRGRQFLAGQDVCFHLDLSEGAWTSLSIYNQGGSVPNAEGRPHQQVGGALGTVRLAKWHHLAAAYDGQFVSFFFDGVLKGRPQAARDFLLGAPARGLWVGCYVGTDFWFSGKIDEFRVSDCLRYDPERKLNVGEKVFEVPGKLQPPKQVRNLKQTGAAGLEFTMRKLYGGNAAGWAYLKPPGQQAAIVGQYALTGLDKGAESTVRLDVSDEVGPEGSYILALEPTDTSAYFAVTSARLTAGGNVLAEWSGEAASRRTFQPPVLVPLQIGPPSPLAASGTIVLGPRQIDRMWGQLDIDDEDPSQPPVLSGDGYAEYWLATPRETTYRVHLRYAAAAPRPCDIVIDGNDLNDFDMCAVNSTGRPVPQDAFWEYQGTVTLAPGLHWLRLQDVLPDIISLRLEPTARPKQAAVPWERYPIPNETFLGAAQSWQTRAEFGRPTGSRVTLVPGDQPALRFSTSFANTDQSDVFAGDRLRSTHLGQFDLEPFGRLTFRFEGQGSGHVVALWLVDAKGDEKLVWRLRDQEAGPQDVAVPLSFEGNDVFDPAHVVAICLDLDEGNLSADQVTDFAIAMTDPRLERRDVLAEAPGYAQALDSARRALAAAVAKLPREAPSLESPGFRPWTKPIVPEEHPLYATTTPKPVTRATLGYDLHFTGARSVDPDTLDNFHKLYDFGDVCWPHIGILPLKKNSANEADYHRALAELETRLEDVKSRGLTLWDIWGYVPNDEAGPTPQIAPEHHEILLRVLGDRFLGYDNGEQDGRYIGSYADRGPQTNRRECWDDFVKWDQHICDDSMNYMNATGSLNFSHYYGERGCRTLGLETAQGLPSDTLMFAFLRGAAKQYGRLMTQAASIWSRFGYNMYQDRRTDGPGGYGYGPHKGCSLSLHQRLFLSSYLGGDSVVGSETSQFTADRLQNGAPQLSPLGQQHLAIHQWAKAHPDRGVMYTPVAFMLDFYNGWNMPRHLYRGDKYKIWGKLPYEKGDYLIDGMFRLVWPGYEDCSYLRNERGFITPTPYGDLFDVITNRCHPNILRQYTCIMLLGDVEMTSEAVRHLTDFANAGGDLIVDGRQARALEEALTGVKLGDQAQGVLTYLLTTRTTFDEQPYTFTRMALAGAQALLVNESGEPLVTVAKAGRGRVIVCAVDYWLTDRLTYRNPDLVNMEPPYTLLRGVRAVLDPYFGSFSPVAVEPAGLNVRVCCYDSDPKRLLVGLMSNDLFAEWRGRLKLRRGQVASARGLWNGASLPAAREIPLSIRPGDVALVDLRLK